jgi:hypothetical protein
MPIDVNGFKITSDMAKTFSYKDINTMGLKFYLDAAVLESYPGSGTAWYDLTGNGYNGTLTNGPTYSSSNSGSIVFDGSNDYVSVPHAFDVSTGGASWNIWFNTTSTSQSPLFSDWYSSVWAFNIQIYSGEIFIGIRNSDNVDLQGAILTYSISTNLVYNICVTYDKTSKITSLYPNGVLYSTGSNALANSAIRNTSNSWSIGYKQDSGNFYSGNIYSAQIYNRALSASENAQNYNIQKIRFGL